MTAHERVVSALEQLIASLEPGFAIPSESELARSLSVSRLTVREGVRALEARGLIDVHHGRRPVVAPVGSSVIEEFFSMSIRQDPRYLLELLEIRMALEIKSAALAAQRCNGTTSQAMANALDAMWSSTDSPEEFDLADVRFHEAVATAASNQMLSFLIEALAEPLRVGREHSRNGHIARGRPLEAVISEHEAIYNQIRTGDAKGAAEAMRQHLRQSERSLRTALSLGEQNSVVKPSEADVEEAGPEVAGGPNARPVDLTRD